MRVFSRRLRASDRWLTLHVAPNEEGPARLGISVGRRFGSAVQRNRIKRLIREAFRRVRHDLPVGVDWIVVPRPAIEPTVPDLMASLLNLARRLEPRVVPDASGADPPSA